MCAYECTVLVSHSVQLESSAGSGYTWGIYLCDTIRHVLACLPGGNTDVTGPSHPEYLSCLLYLLCMLAIPFEFLIYLSRLLF